MKFSIIKRKIYFSPLGRIISLMMNAIAHLKKPFMVYGYYDFESKKFLPSVRISSSAYIIDKRKLKMGDNVWIWHNSIIDASNGVTIGEGCQIGANVGIFSHSSHMAIRLMGKDFINIPKEDRIGYVRKKTEIGEYTFISSGSYILAGVKVGKGCVIGSNTVVTKDIPDFSVVAGAPAKVIKSILDDDKEYFHDEYVLNNYFDREVVKDFLSK